MYYINVYIRMMLNYNIKSDHLIFLILKNILTSIES